MKLLEKPNLLGLADCSVARVGEASQYTQLPLAVPSKSELSTFMALTVHLHGLDTMTDRGSSRTSKPARTLASGSSCIHQSEASCAEPRSEPPQRA